METLVDMDRCFLGRVPPPNVPGYRKETSKCKQNACGYAKEQNV